MRYVGMVLVVVLVPILIAWLKSNPPGRKWAYFAIGALPLTINAFNLDASFVSWPTWPGYADGVVFTALDALALAIVVTTPGAFRRLPLLGFILVYFLATIVSLAFSSTMMSSFFYVFQVLRVLLVYVAVATIVTRPDGLRWLAMGLAAGALYQAGVTLDQRMSGAVQATGTLGHQNLLGMMLHYVTLPLLAMLLAGLRSKLAYAGIAAALLAVAMGASRGAIGFIVIGMGLVLIMSLMRGATPQKWKVLGFGVIALAVMGPLMMAGLDRRFEINGRADNDGYDERAAFERAASMMWSDHPMGVGANQYVVSVNGLGYNNQAGIASTYASRSAKVHHLYLLVGAETGYLGFFSLIALFAATIWTGMRFALRARRDARGDVVLGFTIAVLTTAIHSLYEWIFVTYQTQYMFAIAMGVIAGYARQANSQSEAAFTRPSAARQAGAPKNPVLAQRRD